MIYKFRSMYTDAEINGPQWAERNDHRCTRLGRLLRNTRLDELPQLWNILKGDMSFVGPRPERACFYEEFETYIQGFHNRLLVQPGLTGWAQVNGRDRLGIDMKARLDGEYAGSVTLTMDLTCICRTLANVLKGLGVVEGGTGERTKQRKENAQL